MNTAFAEEAVDAAPEKESVKTILSRLPDADPDAVWAVGQTLVDTYAKDRETLMAAQDDVAAMSAARARVAYSFALLKMGLQREGTELLHALMTDAAIAESVKLQAASLLGTHGGEYGSAYIRRLLRSNELPEGLRVELARSLWKLTQGGTAYEVLFDIQKNGKSNRARAEATLSLARFGKYDDVENELKELAERPGSLGDQARVLLDLNRKVRLQMGRDDFPALLVRELVNTIRQRYAPDVDDKEEQEQLSSANLATEAARAMVHSIDPFNDYLDEESYRSMIEQIGTGYGGIGAYVGMRDNRFTIITPMYGQPAYQAGLESMDVVEKIDGVDVTNMKLNEIVKRLKGPPNTKVTATIWRRGWQKPRDFTMTRKHIEIPSVIAQVLPGDIGYIHLTSFAENTARDLRKEIKNLKRKKVNGIILDLTNNPGGLLTAAVNVSEVFLESGKLVVYSKGKEGVQPRSDYYANRRRSGGYDGPMVVMINEGSASASEIVAGALRDHERARLVGRKSYGKGSVQQLLPVMATRGLTRVKLTIAKYYLPKGDCIHKKGIKPDVEVEDVEIPASEVESRWKFREERELDNWVEANFNEHEAEFRKLLAFDHFSYEGYPGFQKLYTSLKDKYPKLIFDEDIVRKELRTALRRFLRNRRGEDFPADLEQNVMLQNALLELGKQMPGGLPQNSIYDAVRKRVEKEDKALAASDKKKDEPVATPGN